MPGTEASLATIQPAPPIWLGGASLPYKTPPSLSFETGDCFTSWSLCGLQSNASTTSVASCYCSTWLCLPECYRPPTLIDAQVYDKLVPYNLQSFGIIQGLSPLAPALSPPVDALCDCLAYQVASRGILALLTCLCCFVSCIQPRLKHAVHAHQQSCCCSRLHALPTAAILLRCLPGVSGICLLRLHASK